MQPLTVGRSSFPLGALRHLHPRRTLPDATSLGVTDTGGGKTPSTDAAARAYDRRRGQHLPIWT